MKHNKENSEANERIELSPEMQRRILKFFMKTSMPRKARTEAIQKKEKALAENEGQDII